MDYKIGIWNIKSMNNGKKQKEIKKFIYEEKIHVFSVIETHVKASRLQDVCNKVFGQWDWVSNMNQCRGGCRITVGWNRNVVHVMVLHSTRQMILCLVSLMKRSIVALFMLIIKVLLEESCGETYKWLRWLLVASLGFLWEILMLL